MLVGSGVFMDNMLYIIVGLVFILLVVALVLLKKKTPQLPAQTSEQTGKNSSTDESMLEAKMESTESNQSTTSFDPIIVAQRFMDQQRYDKAIDTIERALVKNPKDAKLSLKLLNIYAITNQYDAFDATYSMIKSFDDAETLNKADQLKALLEQEQTQNQPVETESDNDTAFESLDFDLTTPQDTTDTNPASNLDNLDDLEAHSKPVATSQVTPDNDYSTDDNFDLTLDDLETDLESDLESDLKIADTEVNILEPTTNNDAFDITKDTNSHEMLNEKKAEPVIIEDVSTAKNINVDDDFMLDFDLMSNDSNSSALDFIEDTQAQSSQSKNTSSDNDFILELDDLMDETDSTDSLEDSVQANSEDYALPLEDEGSLAVEDSALTISTLATEETIQEATSDNDSVFDNDDILDNDVADTFAQLDTTNVKDELSISDDTQPVVVNEVSEIDIDTTTLSFNDEVSTTETLHNETHDDKVLNNESIEDSLAVDDEFDFDSVVASPSVSMPVESESNVSIVDDENADSQNVETPASQDIDFAAQFATDFDFVNTLDSNQVTLDLAGQYLQLGEYDSAKRLLNEVITQGNSEQQNQAQEMLARTA